MMMNRFSNLFMRSSSLMNRSYTTTHKSSTTTTTMATASAPTTVKLIDESEYNQKHSFTAIENSFAVVHVGGKQYKVIKGDLIMTDRLPTVEVGEHIVLDKVLLVGTQDSTTIGTPLAEEYKVHAYIEEQSKSQHVTIFKHKRRKNYKRTTGFTPLATTLRIGEIIKKN
ncbi:hypothetical protein CYY_002484 [Polysphondylium violaceum]|uniref:Large ribosomal subunit protein bL21m n=1 Tax=Polysphondylium violaceum TaxID=133409 RepID=A0A8J4V9J8_9MYCE|nr:hypothetical protein CYY_002484 [Polysphondylium violaceum]